jgi:hypothetical protein
MPVGKPTSTTQVYSSRIVTSDPSTGIIEAVIPGNLRAVTVSGTTAAFRWPVAGEVWKIININGTFSLDSPLPIQRNSPTATMSPDSPEVPTINDVAAGDLVLNSPTGKIWVLGDASGANCYSFDNKTFLNAENNLSDVPNKSAAVQNLGIQAGSYAASLPVGWSSYLINFPTVFSNPPVVTVTVLVGTAALAQQLTEPYSLAGITTTQISVVVYSAEAQTANIQWIAIPAT